MKYEAEIEFTREYNPYGKDEFHYRKQGQRITTAGELQFVKSENGWQQDGFIEIP